MAFCSSCGHEIGEGYRVLPRLRCKGFRACHPRF